jgi:hypothetical protein
MMRDHLIPDMSVCRCRKCHVFCIVGCLVAVAWGTLLPSPDQTQGDAYLHLTAGGDAILPDSSVADLNYAKDFSVEAVVKIEPSTPGGRWAFVVAKAGPEASYLASSPGFSLGTEQGHRQTFGQIIVGKVGDGTNQVTVQATEREGYAYAVLTWEVAARRVILYVDGLVEGQAVNAHLDPAHIKNAEVLGLGHKGPYEELKRDIQLARIWNRRLSSDEVQRLWSSFNLTKRHDLPADVSRTALLSEWLMYETCDAKGGTGTTYVKDTAGTNHLRLESPAIIVAGGGSLAAVAPADKATGVNKSVLLTVQGGKGSLSGTIVPPLQYWFDVDEGPQFDTASLKQSGWIAHYASWRPILKPGTLYYWRAKVRDSATPAHTSAFLPVCSFTTEGPSTWFARPRNEKLVYGLQNGTSYANAFNGLVGWSNETGPLPGVIWGPDGVEAGDTLYVCGRHQLDPNQEGFVDRGYINVGASGYSADFPVTMRGDHAPDPGTVVGHEQGYSLKIDRKKYVTLKNLTFEGFNLLTEPLTADGDDVVLTDQPRSTYVTFDGCTMTNAQCLVTLQTGHDCWTFRRNTLTDGGVGIKTIGKGAGPRWLTVTQNTIRRMGLPPFEDPDGHALGLTTGEGYLIQGNYIEDTGTAIEFWTDTSSMRDMVVRDNFIKNVTKKTVTQGHGIAISGENNDSFGSRTGFRVYGNIIVNAEGAGISSNNKDLVEVYNNVIYSCGTGLRFAVMNAPLAVAVLNNMVVAPRERFVDVTADPNVSWPNVTWNNNLYWPVPYSTAVFDTVLTHRVTFDQYRRVLGWDQNAVTADPLFVAESPQGPADFHLLGTSPAIGAGANVGINQDYAGNSVPCIQGGVADIGAYEYSGAAGK